MSMTRDTRIYVAGKASLSSRWWFARKAAGMVIDVEE